MVAPAQEGMAEANGAANGAVGSYTQVLVIRLDAYMAIVVTQFESSVSKASCVNMCVTFHGCLFNISGYA